DRRLVEREFHPVIAAGNDLAHQRGILGSDIVADELGHVRESQNAIVEGDPVVHLTQFDIANHVIQRLKNPFGGSAVRLRRVPRLIHGKVGAAVPAAIHEAMTRFAVGGNGTDANGAVVVTDIVRSLQDRGALAPRVFDTRVDVGYFQGNIYDAV